MHNHRDWDDKANFDSFEEFHDLVAKDLAINEANVMLKCLEIPMLQVKYSRYKKRQEREVARNQKDLDNIAFQKMEWSRFESKKDYSRDKVFENFLKAEPAYQTKWNELQMAKEFLGYLDRTINTINNMSFHITNYRNMKGFNLGE